MTDETLDQRRARFVRTILAWHGKRPADLAGILGREPATAYKKLDGRRVFTSDDLIKIADSFKVEPGLLLRPPATLAELGIPTSESVSAWSRTAPAVTRHLRLVA